jgi:hypothetical protein
VFEVESHLSKLAKLLKNLKVETLIKKQVLRLSVVQLKLRFVRSLKMRVLTVQ